MMEFLKEAPAYHWMTDDAHAEGVEEGFGKGRTEGIGEGLQRAIVLILESRFPNISLQAQEQLAHVRQIAPLEKLVDNLARAQTADEAVHYLAQAVEECRKSAQANTQQSH